MSDVEPSPPSSPPSSPTDYELVDTVTVTETSQLKALGDPLRQTLLDLVLERAMSVSEMAARVGRPRGSIAHHVDVLRRAELLQVVRTRRVRAVEERFYGRTARTIVITDHGGDDVPFLRQALAEIDHDAVRQGIPGTGFTLRHARIPAEQAQAFLDRVLELAVEFSASPRGGEREYALIAGVYPTARTLGVPAADERSGSDR